MIDFEGSPELALLRDTARAFAQEELAPRHREFEAARAVAPEVRQRFLTTGLAALELPEAQGGGGLGAVARGLVLEELARADAGAALALDPIGPALYPVLEFGGEEAVGANLVPLLERDGARAVLAWDPRPLLRTESGLVHGVLPWLPCDHLDVLVGLEKERGYVVTGGLTCEAVRGAGLRAAGASTVRVEAGGIQGDWVHTPSARRALARARLYVTALLVGVMHAASEFASQYAGERVAFGRPIAHHQALAFLLVDMHTAVESARLLLWEAATRIDRGEEAIGACAAAFLEAQEQAAFVTQNAVQVLGGHGFMQDYPVEKWMREARALSLLLGGADEAAEDAARELRAEAKPLALTAAEA